MHPLPFGSSVKLEEGFDGLRIILPKKKRQWSDLGGGLFLCFWLGGWAFGEYFVSLALIHYGLSGIGWFLAAWLGGWTVGGAMAILSLVKLIRGDKAEEIILGAGSLTHSLKNKKVFEKDLIDKIVLDAGNGVHWLSFDYGADRIFVGENMKAPEREWLFSLLKDWKKGAV